MQLPPDIELVTTGDGSPTLAFRRADGYVEKMHHSGGAFAESVFIYRHALELARGFGEPLRVLSIGLGLGYNELLTLGTTEAVEIISCETVPFLREQFAAWAGGDDAVPLAPAYADIAARVSPSVRARAALALDDGRLQLRGGFPEALADIRDVHVVYFDAYSNKMDPHLWDEEMLVETFRRTLAPRCVLGTYAATGALNRVLRRLDFTRLPRPGFLGKRQSTLAVRGEP